MGEVSDESTAADTVCVGATRLKPGLGASTYESASSECCVSLNLSEKSEGGDRMRGTPGSLQ